MSVISVRHCPDPQLQLVFKCKPQQQWTAAEIQERLDEFQREAKYTQNELSLLAQIQESVRPRLHYGHIEVDGLESSLVKASVPQVQQSSAHNSVESFEFC